MMRAFVVSLLVSMASGLVVTQRPAATQRRGDVKMIYGARNPTGPYAGAPCQVQWRVEAASESVTGVPFYITNGQDQVAGRTNVLYDCPGVDQNQCLIKARSNGDTAIVGTGNENPTLVRSVRDGQWGEWDVIYKGQNRWLFSGDQISLDYYNPEAAVFQLTEENVGMDWQSWQNGMAEQFRTNKAFGGSQAGGLPPGWYTTQDPQSGQTYYCNEATGECSWDPPPQY
mmetsp:Transcript_21774/g.50159  ORF Transcript_21774/g.50159 Transcript_21774/m.50159 type:complete len:228 (+) Transcript_21774:54-737(+)